MSVYTTFLCRCSKTFHHLFTHLRNGDPLIDPNLVFMQDPTVASCSRYFLTKDSKYVGGENLKLDGGNVFNSQFTHLPPYSYAGMNVPNYCNIPFSSYPNYLQFVNRNILYPYNIGHTVDRPFVGKKKVKKQLVKEGVNSNSCNTEQMTSDQLCGTKRKRNQNYSSKDGLNCSDNEQVTSGHMDIMSTDDKEEPHWPAVPDPHRCETCGKGFPTRQRLKAHLRSHSENRPFPCELCDKAFKTRNVLENHLRIHRGEKRFPCDQCNYATHQKNALVYHKKNLHDKIKDFICDVCGRPFPSPYVLNAHKQIHEEKKFKCEHCGKAFHCKKNYIVHLELHNPNRTRIPCEFCGASFTSSTAIKNHIRYKHLGEKKKTYKCDVCEKVITNVSSLKVHQRKHTGEKPFKCDTCDKLFISKTQLVMHERVHTGEKPYKCHLCEKSFTQRGTLTVHMRIHSGLRPYECDKCPKSFVTGTLLRTHMKSHT